MWHTKVFLLVRVFGLSTVKLQGDRNTLFCTRYYLIFCSIFFPTLADQLLSLEMSWVPPLWFATVGLPLGYSD